MEADYSGSVEPGGPAAHRQAGGLEITKLSVGPMDNNVYLLRCRATGAVVLIDAANDAPRLLAELAEVGVAAGEPDAAPATSLQVITTHRHADHWQALADVVAATGAKTIAHLLDAPELPVAPHRLVEHGEKIQFGEAELEVILLQGHTPGSVALRYRGDPERDHLFVGDCLFPGGVGRTTSPQEFTSLLDDLTARVFDVLEDRTWVYPGHGSDTTLGAERPHLEEWRARGW